MKLWKWNARDKTDFSLKFDWIHCGGYRFGHLCAMRPISATGTFYLLFIENYLDQFTDLFWLNLHQHPIKRSISLAFWRKITQSFINNNRWAWALGMGVIRLHWLNNVHIIRHFSGNERLCVGICTICTIFFGRTICGMVLLRSNASSSVTEWAHHGWAQAFPIEQLE